MAPARRARHQSRSSLQELAGRHIASQPRRSWDLAQCRKPAMNPRCYLLERILNGDVACC